MKKLMRGEALLYLRITSREELVRDVKAAHGLGCSDLEMVEFRILRAENKAKSRITALYLRRTDSVDLRRTP